MMFGFSPWAFGPGDDDRRVDPAGVDASFGCRWALEDLLDIEPGPAAIALLGAINPAQLDAAGRVRLVQAWERQHGWITAQQQAALVDVAGIEPATGDDFAREEVAARSACRAGQRPIGCTPPAR